MNGVTLVKKISKRIMLRGFASHFSARYHAFQKPKVLLSGAAGRGRWQKEATARGPQGRV